MPFSRRTLLGAASALPFMSLAATDRSKRSIKPKALREGDTIGLVAPSTNIQPEDLDLAISTIKSLGFKPKPGPHALEYWGYFAGTDEHRAQDLNAAFSDPEVDGIICLTGGYGAARFLEKIDFEAILRNPKVIMGYSDITALLVGIYAQTGLTTFHGPVAISTYSEFDVQNFTKVVKTAEPAGLIGEPAKPVGHAPSPGAATLFPGKATGRLVGGNLTLVSSLVGSPFLPSFKDHIVFLEDIGEDPYRIDRMLNTLWISGAMKGVKGLMFGDFSLRSDQPHKAPKDPARDFSMQDVLQHFADQMKVPTFCGAWFGHISDKYTLPLGIHAEIDAEARSLTILEAAVTSRQ